MGLLLLEVRRSDLHFWERHWQLLGCVCSFASQVDYPNKRIGNLYGPFVNLSFGQVFSGVRIKSGRMHYVKMQGGILVYFFVFGSLPG